MLRSSPFLRLSHMALLLLLLIPLMSQDFSLLTGFTIDGLKNGTVEWGDMDNDDDLDLIIIGNDDAGKQDFYVYENNGDNTFTQVPSPISPSLLYYGVSEWLSAQWYDIDNDGYLDIVLTEFYASRVAYLSIFQNNGNKTFTLQKRFNYPVWHKQSSFDLGDLDNDADIDIFLYNMNGCKVYVNNGGFEFQEVVSADFPGLNYGDCDLGDYDLDGDLDVIITGAQPSYITYLYKNIGNASFELQDTVVLPNLNNSTVEWGDFNYDTYPDLLFSGYNQLYLYKNNGDNSFSEIAQYDFPGYSESKPRWGDIDNDGDLDVIGCTSTGVNFYYNNGDETFSSLSGTGFPGLNQPSIAPGDIDNDGDLDLVVSGDSGVYHRCYVFESDTLPSNPLPAAPLNVSSEVSGSKIILKWDPVGTDNTDGLSMTYNLQIGTSSGSADIIHPSSSGGGFYRKATPGNLQTDTFHIVENMPKGTYYWKVQAVDNSFKGGPFSSEGSFSFNIDCQAYGLSTTSTGGSEVSLSWLRGNGDNCIVFAKKDASDNANPADITTYTASTTFGDGSEISGTAWYCVYNGSGTSVRIKGLESLSSYTVQVLEYNGSSGSEIYQRSISTDNDLKFNTGLFTELVDITLPPANGSRSQSFWVDIDNDEDLDILMVNFSSNIYLYRNLGNETFSSITITQGYKTAGIGDFNNDGYIDLAMVNGAETAFFTNDGSGNFSKIAFTLSGFNTGTISWADFDIDGDLDLLISGEVGSHGTMTRLFTNNGDETFTEVFNHGIITMRFTATDWADINHDGYIDLAISGITVEGSSTSRVFINNTDGTFTDIGDFGATRGYVEWGDYDNDGDFDLTVMSWYGNQLFNNDGSNNFTRDYNVDLGNSQYGSGHWGDYNNDGFLDIMINGYESGYVPAFHVLKNMQNGSFEEDTSCNLEATGFSSSAWGDFDNDGDLDILWVGENGGNEFSKVYRNESTSANVIPEIPQGLVSNISKSEVTLTWNSVADNSTPKDGITYNIRVGTSSGGSEIVSPHSTSSGYRMIANKGNSSADTLFKLKNLPFDTYYWSVQAIDHSFSGSGFSFENTFSVVPVQVSSLSAEIINSSSLLLRWDPGNGGRRVVFCKETESGTASPVDATTYLPDGEFGYGEELGSTGWFCVYNGRADSAIITGLTYNTNYSFHVIEYMGGIGSEQYFTELVDGNPGIFSTGLFTKQNSITISEQQLNEFAWGDYNNDGLIDVFIPGPTSRLMRNNGDNTFSEDNTSDFPDYKYGSCDWGDYDNDGDLDLAITGELIPSYTPFSAIYRNESGGVFTDQTPIILIDLKDSDIEWGDYNGDGFLDLAITGAAGSDLDPIPTAKIYQNIDGTAFIEYTETSLTGTFRGTVNWVDVDSDGDMDLNITGSLYKDPYWPGSNSIYLNDSGTFILWSDQLPALYDARVDWGDYDHDGYMDVIMSTPGSMYAFRNNGTPNFEQVYSFGQGYSSDGDVKWGDFDNDGYLDILFGNFGSAAKIFKNINGQYFEEFDDGSFKFTSVQNMDYCDYDNDGDIDILVSSYGGEPTIYRNNLIMESGAFDNNLQAEAPVGLQAVRSPEGLKLYWSPVTTDETPSQCLTYNVRIGTSIDTFNVTSPLSDSSGFFRMAKLGNASVDTSFVIDSLESGRYYWQVQAVDMGLNGGKWSAIDSFDVKNLDAFFDYDTVCQGFPTSFTDLSVSTEAIDSWYWDFFDGTSSTVQFPMHTFNNGGTHQVKLIIESAGTFDSTTVDVVVNPKPLASFTSDVVCQSSSTSFTNTTDINGTTPSSWNWDFGNGAEETVQDPPPMGYLTAGNYNVKLVILADNGCADSVTNTITVAEYPSATIATVGTPSFCSGNNIKLSVPDDDTYTYQWHIDGVDISAADSSVYYAALGGNYTVTVTNPEGNCTKLSPTAATVVVYPTPSSPYILNDGETTFCQGDSAELSISSYSNASYQWKLGGGAVGTSKNTYVAKVSGNYTVEVTNSSGCTASSSNTVSLTVNPSPVIPTVGVAVSKVICQGDSLELNVTNNPALTYTWLKDNNPLEGGNTNLWYAKESGKYELQLSNSYPCVVKTDSVQITVNPSPSAPVISYTGDTSFCSSDSLKMSVSTVDGITYQWIFNGGEVGTDSSIFIARNTGNYSIIAANEFDCTAEAAAPVIVLVLPSPATPAVSSSKSTAFCFGDSTRLSVPDDSELAFQWNKDGGSIGDDVNSYLVTASGDYSIRVTSSNGCSRYSNVTSVTVLDAPSLPTISLDGTSEFCKGGSVQLSVYPQSGVSYDWFSGGSLIAENSSDYTATSSGNYSVRATKTITQCKSSTEPVSITVYDLPEVPPITRDGNDELCEGDTLILAFTANAEDIYEWIRNSGIITGETYTRLDITESGAYWLQVTNSESCTVLSSEIDVTVKQKPENPVIVSENYTLNDCPSLNPVRLRVGNITENAKYQWLQSGEAFVGEDSTVLEGYLEEGVYRVEATLYGCMEISDAIDISYASTPEKPTIIAEGPTIWYLACSNDSASAYRWFYNDMEISGANEFIYLANDKVGKYEVAIAEKADGCYALSDPIWIPLGTGVVENPFAGLKIYPNPTPGKFTLEMENSLMGELLIDIFNEQGSKILNVKFFKETARFKTEIDLSGQPSALYLISLTLDKYRIQEKLVVE